MVHSKKMVIKLERSILWGRIQLKGEVKEPGDYVSLCNSFGGSITSFRVDTPDQGTIVTTLNGVLATAGGYADLNEAVLFEGKPTSTFYKDEINRADIIPPSFFSVITSYQEKLIWEEDKESPYI